MNLCGFASHKMGKHLYTGTCGGAPPGGNKRQLTAESEGSGGKKALLVLLCRGQAKPPLASVSSFIK